MFKDRDIICFLGDSITASGLWMAEAYQFLRKKYKIKCYNCGVSGATAHMASGYLYSECLIHNPDYVVMMFGMNDLGRLLYTKENIGKGELDSQRDELIKTHIEKYEEIIKRCKDSGAEVIVCLPTPHDEVTECDAEKIPYQRVLERAAQMQTELARKYNCKVVNFKDNMIPLLGERAIIMEDRVHPNRDGYHVMGQIFLKEIGEIAECDFDTPFEFEEWNRERYDAELKNHKLNFVELCETYYDGYAKGKSADEIKELAKQKLAECDDKDGYVGSAYAEYVEKGHMRSRNKSRIVELTIF